MGAIPAGGNIWKTIIIGVLTTVLAYAIVHFMFDKKDDEGFKRKKEATIGAWKAIVKSNEFYLDDYYSAFCLKSDSEIVKNLHKAIDKQINDYELMQKKQDLDDDLGLYINRFLDRGRDMKKLIQEYYDALSKIEKDTSLSQAMKELRSKEAENNYMPSFTSLPKQDSGKIATLYLALTKKYGDEFKTLLKPTTTDEVIEGKWREGDNKFFSFNKDHSLLMTVDLKDYPGKWRISNNILTLEFDENSKANYYIIYYGPDYIRFHVDNSDVERQLCRQ